MQFIMPASLSSCAPPYIEPVYPQTRTTAGMCAMCKCLKNPEWLGKPDAMTDVMVMVVVVVGVSWCHCRVLRTCGSRWSPFLSSRTRGCVLRDSGWEEGDLRGGEGRGWWCGGRGGVGGVGGWVRAIALGAVCLSVSVQTQLDASPSRGGDSSEEPPSLSSGGFSAPQVSTHRHAAHSDTDTRSLLGPEVVLLGPGSSH